MAVDRTLISGAYKANKPQKVAGIKEIGEIGETISGALNNYMVAEKAKHTLRSAEYEAYAQSVLSNSDLVGDQYEALYDDLMSGKQGYADSDKKTRDIMVRDLKAMSGDYEDYKTLREDVAINMEDYSPAFTNSEEGQMYLEVLKGDGKKLVNNNGRIGIEVNGEWRSISSIKQELDKNKIDKTSIDALEAFRIKEQDSDDPFDRQKTRMTIMNQLVSKGSYNSLKNDEIIPGRIFRNDLAESLMNQTYADLGITDEDFEGIEGVNSDGVIDADEAENIIAHLEGDETEMKEVMADYYTSYIQNNGGSSASESEADDDLSDGEGEDVDIDVESEEINVDESGVYVPTGANQATGRDRAFRSRIKRDYMDESKVSDEDIQAYFNSMEGKLNTEIFNTANFQQWLRSNNKEIPLRY